MLNGLDVSNHNNITDWSQIKANGYEIIVQKASEGLSYTDALLYYRYSRIKQADLKISYYHFARNNNPEQEAQHFINCIQNLPLDCIVWLDIEDEGYWNRQSAINYTNRFISYMNNHGYNNKIGVYTSESFYEDYLRNNIPNVPLWIAKYSSNPPATYPTYSWQYTEKGTINSAVVGFVDKNYFKEDILLSNSQPQVQINQPNKFCINQKGKSPILPYKFISTSSIKFRKFPDENSEINGERGEGFEVSIFGKTNTHYLVNNGNPQYVAIKDLKATQPLNIEKVSWVCNYNGSDYYENPSDVDSKLGNYPYRTYLPVYTDTFGFYLTCGNNDSLKWVNNNADLRDVYPNNYSKTINANTQPIFTQFYALEDTPILDMPINLAKNIGTVKKDEVINIYGKFGEYFLINPEKREFVYIPKFANHEKLSVTKKVRVINANGGFCRENISNRDITNGIVPVGKELSVWCEKENYYLVNPVCLNLQWISKEDCEDVI